MIEVDCAAIRGPCTRLVLRLCRSAEGQRHEPEVRARMWTFLGRSKETSGGQRKDWNHRACGFPHFLKFGRNHRLR